LCGVPVYLVASPMKAFFFRHRSEDGSCPAITRSFETEDEIRARKYAGLQESEPHKRLKALLLRAIDADPRFEAAAAERVWRSVAGGASYRRPDVSCAFKGLRIAFEAQLTTTFLSVVVGRRSFYRDQGGLLVWVLARFDPDNRRMTEDDILFPNNANVLVVDEETVLESERLGRFMVRCWHRIPGRRTEGRADWACRIVAFDALTLDVAQQQAFLVDVAGEEAAARARALAEGLAAQDARDRALRADFTGYCLTPMDERGDLDARRLAWDRLRARVAERGHRLPPTASEGHEVERVVKLVLSARDGAPRGWQFRRLTEIAHHLHESHPRLLFLFGQLLRHYGHADVLTAEDRKGAWARKASRLRAAVAAGDLGFQPDCTWFDLLGYMFPETVPILRKLEAQTPLRRSS